jgi:hypothetical protein
MPSRHGHRPEAGSGPQERANSAFVAAAWQERLGGGSGIHATSPSRAAERQHCVPVIASDKDLAIGGRHHRERATILRYGIGVLQQDGRARNRGPRRAPGLRLLGWGRARHDSPGPFDFAQGRLRAGGVLGRQFLKG